MVNVIPVLCKRRADIQMVLGQAYGDMHSYIRFLQDERLRIRHWISVFADEEFRLGSGGRL